jgi:uncharacterized membrane protein
MTFIATGQSAMNAFTVMLERHPLIFFHLVTAFGALIIGLVLLTRRKGTADHRWLGWTWVALMASTAVAAAFIRDYRMPNLFGFTPIHGFVLLVAYQLPRGIWFIRRGNIGGHRATMQGLFKGACVIAFVFTLLPGRFLGTLLWKNALGVMA